MFVLVLLLVLFESPPELLFELLLLLLLFELFPLLLFKLAQNEARSGSESTSNKIVSGAFPSFETSMVKFAVVPAFICCSGPFVLLKEIDDAYDGETVT